MAQQLKFVACLKILMEELSTLATGYEVDGGELRYHLYLWLEREVDALRHLCNYSVGDIDYAGKMTSDLGGMRGDPASGTDYMSSFANLQMRFHWMVHTTTIVI